MCPFSERKANVRSNVASDVFRRGQLVPVGCGALDERMADYHLHSFIRRECLGDHVRGCGRGRRCDHWVVRWDGSDVGDRHVLDLRALSSVLLDVACAGHCVFKGFRNLCRLRILDVVRGADLDAHVLDDMRGSKAVTFVA